MSVLTILECGSIQNYIFASNRLKEAIGASYLVKQALEANLTEALEVIAGRQGVSYDNQGWAMSSGLSGLSEAGLKAEVLYIGGGKAAVLFVSNEIARQTLAYLSSRLLVQAPGLLLYAGQSGEIETTPGGLGRAWRASLKDLNARKERGKPSSHREGLALTSNCATTGLAATIRYPEWKEKDRQKKIEILSASAAARRSAAKNANQQTLNWLKGLDGGGRYRPPENLDNLGGREGEDHLAVVHIDGNSIGSRLDKLVTEYSQQSNDELAVALRQFSHSVQAASDESLSEIAQSLLEALKDEQEGGLFSKLDLKKKEEIYFPLRLLISGGDDLTFVCEGRLGLTLAARYLQLFGTKTDSRGQPFSACAGVVIARNHFPLARAYQLSEELCRRAKQRAKESEEVKVGSSWLDFQILFSGLNGSLAAMRDLKGLYWRPYRVVGRDDEKSWEYFEQHTRRFGQEWPRSQVKALAEALIEDATNKSDVKTASQQFLTQAELRGNVVYKQPQILLQDGWANDKTPLFDSIEALDFYLEIKD